MSIGAVRREGARALGRRVVAFDRRLAAAVDGLRPGQRETIVLLLALALALPLLGAPRRTVEVRVPPRTAADAPAASPSVGLSSHAPAAPRVLRSLRGGSTAAVRVEPNGPPDDRLRDQDARAGGDARLR